MEIKLIEELYKKMFESQDAANFATHAFSQNLLNNFEA